MNPEEKKTLNDLKEVVNQQSKAIRMMAIAIDDQKKKYITMSTRLSQAQTQLNIIKMKSNNGPFGQFGF